MPGSSRSAPSTAPSRAGRGSPQPNSAASGPSLNLPNSSPISKSAGALKKSPSAPRKSASVAPPFRSGSRAEVLSDDARPASRRTHGDPNPRRRRAVGARSRRGPARGAEGNDTAPGGRLAVDRAVRPGRRQFVLYPHPPVVGAVEPTAPVVDLHPGHARPRGHRGTPARRVPTQGCDGVDG